MLFSTKAEYGIRVLVELAKYQGTTPLSLAEIADHGQLPIAYLEHLVARLKKAELIESRRGARGGYLLSQPADEIRMSEVIEVLEGSVIPIECIPKDRVQINQELEDASSRSRGCPGFSPDSQDVAHCLRVHSNSEICPTKLLWTKVQASIIKSLEETTLADLIVEKQSLVTA